MSLTRCKAGHSYEQTKHTTCPHCGIPGLDMMSRLPFFAPKQQVETTNNGRNDKLSNDNSHSQANSESAWLEPPKIAEEVKNPIEVFDPVVGWLVCIEGALRGQDFAIRAGRNSIGRSQSMMICMSDDTISYENHAYIVYEMRQRRFRIQVGSGKNSIYLNNDDVTTFSYLNNFDIVEIGSVKLVFMALCGEKFQWSIE